MSEVAVADRPREKLLQRGPRALSDEELLAVLLRTGTAGTSVLELSRQWLDEAGGLGGLAGMSPGQIMGRNGVGPAKGAVLAAALELGERLARRKIEDRPVLDRPEAVAEYLARSNAAARVEVFGCLTLDARNRLIRTHALHRGARAHSDVEPGEVFHRAIVDNAHGVILWHTHPSGDPSPSEDDLALTRRLAQAGRLLNVAVLDHLVVGSGGWISLRQRGVLPLN